MARQRSVITRCRNCQIDSVHLDDRRYGWQLRITYLADEKAYLTHPCSGCGEWQMRHVDGQELHHLVHFGVPVDDLSLVEPGLERDTMPDPTVDELCHMFWIAYHQQSGWRITVEWSDDLPGGCVLHLLNVRNQHTSHVDYATPQDVRLAITDTDMLDTLARMSVEHYAGLIDLTRIDLTGEVA